MSYFTKCIFNAYQSVEMDLDFYERLIPQYSAERGISKIIHQTSISKQLSPELSKNIANLKLTNPGWDYILYDDNDINAFIKKEYGEDMLRYYERIDPKYGAARADLFRYLVVYRYGGVYLDIKSSATKPFDEILLGNDALVLSYWDRDKGELHEGWGGLDRHVKVYPTLNPAQSEYTQWNIISSQGNPIMREIIIQVLHNIDNYSPLRMGIATEGVLRTTGPIAYTAAIERVKDTYPDYYRIAGKYRELGLVYSIFEKEGEENRLSHRESIKSSYHKQTTPVIKSRNSLDNMIWRISIAFKRMWHSRK